MSFHYHVKHAFPRHAADDKIDLHKMQNRFASIVKRNLFECFNDASVGRGMSLEVARVEVAKTAITTSRLNQH